MSGGDGLMQLVLCVILAGAHIGDATHNDRCRVLIVCRIHNAPAFHLHSSTIIEMSPKIDIAWRLSTCDKHFARNNALTECSRRQLAAILRMVHQPHPSRSASPVTPRAAIADALSVRPTPSYGTVPLNTP